MDKRKPSAPLLPAQRRTLVKLGENIRYARLRRDISMEQAAERAGVSRATLGKMEAGDSGVAIGSWLKLLYVLGLDSDLLKVAADDDFGRILQDAKLPSRIRASKVTRRPE
ncbi:MAG: helix-turn-helix domain-containing protein [Spirochaetaceae bacterium]|nr:helix-turn-helix domain-containing protein [Spirochaetaceae bacterium]